MKEIELLKIIFKDSPDIFELLNEIDNKIDNEIEGLNNELKLYKDNHEHLNEVLEQKEIIIKEVREYIESYMPNYDFDKTNLIKLLEILDKEKV